MVLGSLHDVEILETPQVARVVDVQGADPFNGDGFMAKGRLLQLQGDSTRKDANQQFVIALTEYRYMSVSELLCMDISARLSVASLQERHAWWLNISCLVNAHHSKLLSS